ncbi:MAG: helix-turn-helix domain-containing protein [Gammaproteobacteria bacterium]|nr:helix-turn-helix domain-containing protein [Gammaproteobacteria bacterium]
MLIGYARVSTTDQDLSLQTDALANVGCEKIFKDTASGSRAERPGLLEAMEFARNGDSIVVWRLDRLGRSLKDLLDLISQLDERGVGFRSLTEHLDTSTSGGKLIFQVFGAIAEFKRNLIRERTNAGLQAARARGHKGGHPKSLTDKDLAAASALLADPNLTVSEVAARLNTSPATLYRYLPKGGRSAIESNSFG